MEKPDTKGYILYEMSRISKNRKKISCQGPGGGEWGITANGYKVSSWDDENVLELVVINMQLCECTKNTLIIYF